MPFIFFLLLHRQSPLHVLYQSGITRVELQGRGGRGRKKEAASTGGSSANAWLQVSTFPAVSAKLCRASHKPPRRGFTGKADNASSESGCYLETSWAAKNTYQPLGRKQKGNIFVFPVQRGSGGRKEGRKETEHYQKPHRTPSLGKSYMYVCKQVKLPVLPVVAARSWCLKWL